MKELQYKLRLSKSQNQLPDDPLLALQVHFGNLNVSIAFFSRRKFSCRSDIGLFRKQIIAEASRQKIRRIDGTTQTVIRSYFSRYFLSEIGPKSDL